MVFSVLVLRVSVWVSNKTPTFYNAALVVLFMKTTHCWQSIFQIFCLHSRQGWGGQGWSILYQTEEEEVKASVT